jgi:histone deacetylase 11
VYSPRYDIRVPGLEFLHPFDGRKFSKAYALASDGFAGDIRAWTLEPPGPADPARDLGLVHTPGYLASLSSVSAVARILEVPLPGVGVLDRLLSGFRPQSVVLEPMLWATAGTILAARQALRYGSAINLGGGYHHASADRGEGFCVYADVPIALRALWAEGLLGPSDRVLYIDLDAHQGNGVARVFAADPRVCIFDMYNADIYPQDWTARVRIDRDLPLRSGTATAEYLAVLRAELPAYLDVLRADGWPRLAVYNAGTDVFEGDRLGRLQVSFEGVLERDRFVLDTLRAARIPWLLVPSGGYSADSFALLGDTARFALETWTADSTGGPVPS